MSGWRSAENGFFSSPKFGDMEVEDTTGNPRWGVYQLAFTVEDLDAEVARLQAKGAELEDLKPQWIDDGVLQRTR